MKKIAVILFNLGGPDGPKSVRPFLYNLFSDPAIIALPAPWRQAIARLIALRRNKTAQAIYAKIGGRSPLLENTEVQARALEKELRDIGAQCFVCMRHWHPMANEVVACIKTFAPDEIVLLPLFPQFSTTTTASSLKDWRRAAGAAGLEAPTKTVCCYPKETGFIRAMAGAARKAYEQAQREAGKKPRVLFSAHGLPEKIVQAGDPYQWQCERTAEALAQALDIPALDWVGCYQSRVGPLQWIGPSTDEEIRRAGRDGVPLVVVPIAFVSEHSETLVEIDIEYRHLALRSGVPAFFTVPAVDIAPDFIEGLAELVRKALDSSRDCISAEGGRLCPANFLGCRYDRQLL